MKRSLVLLAILTLVFGLTGCVKARVETNLNADGSGTFSMTAAVSESVAEALKELREMKGAPGMQEPPDLDIKRDKLEAACKKHNVKITKFEDSDAESGKMVDMVLEFKDLADLNAVLSSTMDNSGGMKLYKNTDGNYVLRGGEDMGSPDDEGEDETASADDDSTSDDDSDEMNPEDMGKAMEIMGKLMSSMSELEVAMRITVPGDIVSTNAPKTEGRTSIWEINSENMMQTDMGDPEIVFSGKGLKLKAEAEPEGED